MTPAPRRAVGRERGRSRSRDAASGAAAAGTSPTSTPAITTPATSTRAASTLREATDADLDHVARLVHLAFGSPLDTCLTFLRRIPPSYRRVWTQSRARPEAQPAERVCGAAVAIPMGHHFGGSRVASIGVQAVAVAPEARGTGVAKALMGALLRDMSASGAAISTLYASVQSLYRHVGYEHAGVYAHLSINLRMLPRGMRPERLVALGPEHDAAVRSLYEEIAPAFDGSVDRDPYLWTRVRESRGMRYEGFGLLADSAVGGEGRRGRGRSAALDGYLYLAPDRAGDDRTLAISDFAFRNLSAGRRLLAALASFAPTMTVATLAAAPNHPLATLLEQQWHTWQIKDIWMLRVVDLVRAIEQRGYRRGVRVAFRLRCDDEVLATNSGDWVVEIEGGRGRARRPTRVDDQPMLHTSPRGLSTIWSGFLTPRQAQLQGLLGGPDEALQLAESAFAGPTPAMNDGF